MKFIDLFCGIGGFHIALSNKDNECVLACDIDKDCREVYKKNFNINPLGDINDIDIKKIPDFDILCAGFPCQSFSHAGKQKGFQETRGTLFFNICKILKNKKPKFFILENVKNLYTHNKGKTWKIIYDNLIDLGYNTYDKPIMTNPIHFGIPQNRDRVFIIGIRNDIGKLPKYPTYKKQKTTLSSILQSNSEINNILDDIKISDKDISVLELWNEFILHFKKKIDKLPGFPLWSFEWNSNNDDISDLPVWKQKIIQKNRNFYNEHNDFINKWMKKANENKYFTGSKTKLEWQCGNFEEKDNIWTLLFQFRPSGIRIKRGTYSPALVAMNQIVYVGEKKRKLTPREVARLQSFPETYKINTNMNKAYKQFGNSVNVTVVNNIYEHLMKSEIYEKNNYEIIIELDN